MGHRTAAVAASLGCAPELARNDAWIRLSDSASRYEGRWDYACERSVSSNGNLVRYLETVEGAAGGRCLLAPFSAEIPVPGDVHLEVDGITRYRVEGAVFRTFDVARATQGHRASAFAQVGLMNRYSSKRATLALVGLGGRGQAALASATVSEPASSVHSWHRNVADGAVAAQLEDCPARTLLRIYWPLDRA